MKIKDVSRTPNGVQVVVESLYPHYLRDPAVVVVFGDREWPRLRVVANSLLSEVPGLVDAKLVRVDQRRFLGGLLIRQFSWMNPPKSGVEPERDLPGAGIGL